MKYQSQFSQNCVSSTFSVESSAKFWNLKKNPNVVINPNRMFIELRKPYNVVAMETNGEIDST